MEGDGNKRDVNMNSLTNWSECEGGLCFVSTQRIKEKVYGKEGG